MEPQQRDLAKACQASEQPLSSSQSPTPQAGCPRCPSGWSGLRLGHHGLCVSEELDRDPGGCAETRTACGVSQAWGWGAQSRPCSEGRSLVPVPWVPL